MPNELDTLQRKKHNDHSLYSPKLNTNYTKTTPSPIEITNVLFDTTDTNNFNITVHNSALYYDLVRLDNIILTFENGTTRTFSGTTISPTLPQNITQGESKTFRCSWNWADYQGKNVTITAHTIENYVATTVKLTPKRVIMTIASISFDAVNTGAFEVKVRNSAFSVEDANITRITVTLENGTVKEISIITPSPPHLLSPGSTIIFNCQFDWTSYRGKNITVTVYAAKGYTASSIYTTPPLQ